jgi:hypothetical protein
LKNPQRMIFAFSSLVQLVISNFLFEMRLPLFLPFRFGYTDPSLIWLGDERSRGVDFTAFSSRCTGRLAAVLGHQPSYYVHSFKKRSVSMPMSYWHAIRQ